MTVSKYPDACARLIAEAKALIDWIQGEGPESTEELTKRLLLLQVAINAAEEPAP